jgi:hypothetical protein
LLPCPGTGRGQTNEGAYAPLSLPNPSELAPAPSTVRAAIADSFRLLLLEHATRIAFQAKTRRELGGPFFTDYARALRTPRTWDDGDSWAVNYIGHRHSVIKDR